MPSGSCLCGEVKYEYSGEPQVTALCHCLDCQKWSGGAYTANTVVARDSFKVTAGRPKVYTTVGDSGKKNAHFFCGNCGSSLYTELEVMPESTCIKSGGLDDKTTREHPVAVEFYVKDRVTYSSAVESAKQVPQFG